MDNETLCPECKHGTLITYQSKDIETMNIKCKTQCNSCDYYEIRNYDLLGNFINSKSNYENETNVNIIKLPHTVGAKIYRTKNEIFEELVKYQDILKVVSK